ncbi:hypothetical protein BCIN_05g06170 [Botrytis cinerea B05.10]|uniref:C2H2-type domain-containing protein n=1 Tax=Botryotinia fuckeliana (strain B05.10) TaxID=332648 RepID=A0A384JI46_BOTFB|nr:hypothetical protein BCIN_05g06170 [Botrytis cinerea B05.10]ATZ50249.1 hypothetical protein BCIN_05g06170 [Botrytis cinerea B05.10]
MSFHCGSCNRHYGSQKALQQHVRDSPVHALPFDCNSCDRSFNSGEALQQHLRYSTSHTLTFGCDDCDQSFGSGEALDQHLLDSHIYQQNINTPLDVFFCSFPTFNYDRSLPPATSYASLQRHERWQRNSTASDDAWKRYQSALESELHMWYGAEDDLTAWHALCRAVGIEPLPNTCKRCEEAVRKTYVNIVDLIEWGRSERTEKVDTFLDLAELRAYTM